MPSEEARNYTSRTSKEADEIFGKYLKNTISASELGRFIRQVNPDVEFFRISDEEWKFFFSSFEDFMEWIDNAPNLAKPAEDKAEMLDFLNKIRINQFNAVEYTFRKLKPIRWIRGNRSL